MVGKKCKLLVDRRARKCYQETQSFKKPNQKEKIPRVSISGNPTEEMIQSAFKILGTKMFITELLKTIKKLEIT